jgi:hypothetical protein
MDRGAGGTPLAALAERVGVPAGTAVGWLRGVRRSAVTLIRHAVDVAGRAARAGRSAASWLGSDLAEALDAFGDAARAFARAAVPAPVPTPAPAAPASTTCACSPPNITAPCASACT